MPETDTPAGINKNLLLLHFTVFIWGFTSIVGKLISIGAVELVWYRVIIAIISLFLYFKFNRTAFKTDRKTFLQLAFTGALIGLHWILFFESIKLSTVSVTLVCLSSMTLFTAIFEPLINKKRISKLEIIAGVLIHMWLILLRGLVRNCLTIHNLKALSSIMTCKFVWVLQHHRLVLSNTFNILEAI